MMSREIVALQDEVVRLNLALDERETQMEHLEEKANRTIMLEALVRRMADFMEANPTASANEILALYRKRIDAALRRGAN